MFDFFLLPQGRDQNYGLFFACLVSDKRQPLVVSSSNPLAVKQEGNSRYVVSEQHRAASQQGVDYVILYVVQWVWCEV